MGLFDSFFGASQRRDISAANRDASALLNDAYGKASGVLSGATAPARSDLMAGFDAAGNYIGQGITGATGAINTGYDTARNDLTSTYDAARGNVQGAYDRAADILDPFIQAGVGAQGLYSNALGLNGTQAQSDFYSNYADNDPYREFRDNLANNALMALYNARGLGGSGREMMALSRASLERGSTDLNSYLDRLSGQATQGANLSNQLAGYGMQTGQSLANINTGLGDRLSGLETGRGTALGNIQMSGNQALANNETGRGSALANLGVTQANNLANLIYGHGQQEASNRINVGNAMAGTRNTGINNLINLVGTGIKGYATFNNPWQQPKAT